MLFKKEFDLITKLKALLENDDFDHYWIGFDKLPFAIYNNKDVFLVDFPHLPQGFVAVGDNIAHGDWTDSFCGNTTINFSGVQIAILDMDSLTNISLEHLYSILVHESYHAFQMEWMDFSNNELLVTTYPFTFENLSLRILEREYLLKCFREKNMEIKTRLLFKFLDIRLARMDLIGEFGDYETKVETFEGTAKYTEIQALHKFSEDKTKVYDNFIKELLDIDNTFSSFRSTCYTMGGLICFILDDISQNWQESFMNFNDSLFDYLLMIAKEKFQYTRNDFIIDESKNCHSLKELIGEHHKKKEKLLQEFYDSGKYKIEITGAINLAGFDPMNIEGFKNSMLHKRFFRFKLNGQYFFITKGILQFYEENMFIPTKLVIMSQAEPKLSDGIYTIEGIGEIPAENIKVQA